MSFGPVTGYEFAVVKNPLNSASGRRSQVSSGGAPPLKLSLWVFQYPWVRVQPPPTHSTSTGMDQGSDSGGSSSGVTVAVLSTVKSVQEPSGAITSRV